MPEALPLIRDALRLDPDWDAAHRLHADLLGHGGNPGAAIAAARQAAAVDPFETENHLALAWAFDLAGERREAREAVQEALRLDPENADALRFHAQDRATLGKTATPPKCWRMRVALTQARIRPRLPVRC